LAPETAIYVSLRYFCPHCRWEMPPDATGASPGWAFCSVCGTLLSTEEPASLASAPPRIPGPPVRLTYAGFWRRFAGWSIDYLFIIVAVFVAAGAEAVLIAASGADLSAGTRLALTYALALPISGVYYIAFNATGGTLGKQAVGLRLVDEQGRMPGWRRALIRYVISIFSGLVFAWGYWRMAFEPQKQTLHDQAAGTYVVQRDALS
jgi:uncharacterized RDD family membrane protein YckC